MSAAVNNNVFDGPLVAQAREEVRVALRLAPGSAMAHTAQGKIFEYFDRNLVAAEREYRDALELAPYDFRAVAGMAGLQMESGRFEEAIAGCRRAIALEPLSTGSLVNISYALAALGRFDEAEAAIRQAWRLQPTIPMYHFLLAYYLVGQGRVDEALEAAKEEPHPVWLTVGQAMTRWAKGDRIGADVQLKKLIAENADDGAAQIAMLYAQRADTDAMYRWLDHAVETKDPGLIDLYDSAFLSLYRYEPRMQAIARKVGLPPLELGKAP